MVCARIGVRIRTGRSEPYDRPPTVNTLSQPVCDLTASAMYGIICSGLLPVIDGNTPPPVWRVIIPALSPAATPRRSEQRPVGHGWGMTGNIRVRRVVEKK